MDSYLLLKLVHILGASIIAGTGMGIAYFLFMASRSDNIHAIAVTARNVVIADWLFTTPAIVIQLITGIWLMKILGYDFASTWSIVAFSLFIFIGICWIPVVFIQYKLKAIAEAQIEKIYQDKNFAKLMKLWIALGIPAFTGVVIMFWLMVFKPLPVN